MAYKNISKLGEGGFGIVNKVSDESGQEWACKTFKDPQIPDADVDALKKRFRNEVKYQRSVTHPNVVRIIDADLEQNLPFFIMELAECTLRDELTNDPTLNGDPKTALFDILSGLEVIHDSGLIHRDLKPANVLKINNSDGTYKYAISDFGLMTAAESDSSSLTPSNIAGGTPFYAAPECATNFKRATNRSDIYGFGALLHDIFCAGTTRVPYTNLKGTGPIGQIIEKCTQINPVRRYQTVSELRNDLYDALNTEEIQFSSTQEENIIKLLVDNDTLTNEEWDNVFIFMEDHIDQFPSNYNLFRAIRPEHIIQLANDAPDLFAALAREFTTYVQNGTFDFDYCDVLAGKIQLIYDNGELDIKALCALSLLVMGIGHNRWFVENKFMKMASHDISDQQAQRIKVEIEAQGLNFPILMTRLESSIMANRESLHPLLQESLGKSD